MNKNLTFTITIPSEEGFVGRACKNHDCEQYFKVCKESYKEVMFCPYCGEEFSSNELLTSDQSNYVMEVAKEETLVYAQEQFQNMLKKTFGTSSARRSGITFKPSRIQRKKVTPKYKERVVDSELECPECNMRFQVYGIFGYCPGCKEENMLIYDANLKIIEGEIANSKNSERQLRHAYGDLVSTFEKFCYRKSVKLTSDKGHFQVLFDARKFFIKHANTDILTELPKEQLLALRRIFQKRHVYVHSGGVINDKYVQKIPEDNCLLGQKANLSLEELKAAAEGMRVALINLIKAIEEKG